MVLKCLSFLIAIVVTMPLLAQPSTQPAAGTAVFVGDELLHDYHPQSTLITNITRVDRAKFAAIDIHCHWTVKEDPARMVKAMDELGVSHAVNLSGSFGDEFDQLITRFHAVDRDRFIFFVNLDFSKIDEPDFGSQMCAWLDLAKAKGAKGLKIFKSLGLEVKDKSGNVVAVDDPRLDAVWDKCSELGFPVLIHSADPVAFFQPLDKNNERWMQLHRNPTWSYYGKSLPTFQQIIDQRNHVIAAHPKTTFIIAHMAESANDYATLGGWLKQYPNMYIDLSARENEYGRQPFASRRFFIEFADRILFGTDRYPGKLEQPRNRIYYRILETADEYFDYYDHPFAPMGEWKVYGLHLPDDVLEKIYNTNAKRILGLK